MASCQISTLSYGYLYISMQQLVSKCQPGQGIMADYYYAFLVYTLPTDQPFNLEFQFESVFNLEFQPKFSIQLGIPIPMGIYLGECNVSQRIVNVANIWSGTFG